MGFFLDHDFLILKSSLESYTMTNSAGPSFGWGIHPWTCSGPKWLQNVSRGSAGTTDITRTQQSSSAPQSQHRRTFGHGKRDTRARHISTPPHQERWTKDRSAGRPAAQYRSAGSNQSLQSPLQASWALQDRHEARDPCNQRTRPSRLSQEDHSGLGNPIILALKGTTWDEVLIRR